MSYADRPARKMTQADYPPDPLPNCSTCKATLGEDEVHVLVGNDPRHWTERAEAWRMSDGRIVTRHVLIPPKG